MAMRRTKIRRYSSNPVGKNYHTPHQEKLAKTFKKWAPRDRSKLVANRKKRFARTSKKAFLRLCSERLNANLPASDQWFLSLYREHKVFEGDDLINEPFCGFIPDILNKRLRYIIEVQDPTHKKLSRIIKDAKKNVAYRGVGFRVFYIWAWDHNSFDAFLEQFKEFKQGIILDGFQIDL